LNVTGRRLIACFVYRLIANESAQRLEYRPVVLLRRVHHAFERVNAAEPLLNLVFFVA
jgi:hypothetical protein